MLSCTNYAEGNYEIYNDCLHNDLFLGLQY